MRISDWSSDVCSSDLGQGDAALAHIFAGAVGIGRLAGFIALQEQELARAFIGVDLGRQRCRVREFERDVSFPAGFERGHVDDDPAARIGRFAERSEEHTSELQSLMRISYAVFCMKKKKKRSYK